MPVRHFVTHNFWLKVFSIALGLVIWMAIHYSIQHDFALSEPGPSRVFITERMQVPIEVLKATGDTRTFKRTPNEVTLTVFGDRSIIHGPDRSTITAFVDLTDFHSTNAALEEVRADATNNVTVLKIEPSSVMVEPTTPRP